jgi:pyruvate dehydrogenase E1 component alpha subunit
MTKDELWSMFELMYTMRRMEITCDNEYKARNIRGFCHLYDGQEAVATGIQYALSPDDSWITSYRCHCVALARGGSVRTVVGELFGVVDGSTKGKGGSMHFYNKKHNFFGGQGIVGAQVPVGAGLAFANKYNQGSADKMNVAIACYGDGAANQGQIWEAANMCSLWKLVRLSGYTIYKSVICTFFRSSYLLLCLYFFLLLLLPTDTAHDFLH